MTRKLKLGLIYPKGGGFWDGDYSKIKKTMDNRNLDMGHKFMLLTASTYPNLGLLTVAGLTDDSFDIKYIDEYKEDIDYNEKFDLIALTGVTCNVLRAYNIAEKFKSRGVPVAIGGNHASVLPDEAKAHVDSVIIGEAENTWPEFLCDFKKGVIKPFYSSKESQYCDMSSIPPPRYDLIDPNKYIIFLNF